MEQIIRQILDIEQRAQQIVKEAADNKERFAAQMLEEKNKLAADIRQKADKEFEEMQKQIQASAEFQILQIQQKTQQIVAAMDQSFAQKGDIWAEEIFQRVIANA